MSPTRRRSRSRPTTSATTPQPRDPREESKAERLIQRLKTFLVFRLQGCTKRIFSGCVKFVKKLTFCLPTGAGERNFSPHNHTTWDSSFSATLYLSTAVSWLFKSAILSLAKLWAYSAAPPKTFINAREVSARFRLQPGTYSGVYFSNEVIFLVHKSNW